MIVLVTGATAGFGECIARRFVENGHKVIVPEPNALPAFREQFS